MKSAFLLTGCITPCHDPPMGYEHALDTEGRHEGWVAMTYADGKVSSGTSTSAGYYLDGYTYLPRDDNDASTWGVIDQAYLRPYSEIEGWLPRCGCGWTGVEVAVEHDGPEEYRKWREPSDHQEHLIMGQWRVHLRDALPGAYPVRDLAHA